MTITSIPYGSEIYNNGYRSPLIDFYVGKYPLLYAMRQAAKEMQQTDGYFIPKLAQGSPSEAPDAYILKGIVDFYQQGLEEALRLEQLKAIELAEEFDNCNPPESVMLREDSKIVGYADTGYYENEVKQTVLSYLKDIFNTDISPETGIKAENLEAGLYARYWLGIALRVLPKYHFPQTPSEQKKVNRVLLVPRGFWPMVSDLAADNDYDHHVFDLKDKTTISLRDAIVGINMKLASEDDLGVIYLNFPNNPTGSMPEKEDLKTFLVDLAILNHERIEHGLKPITILFDNPYYGWCNPEYLMKEGFFSIYKIAQEIQRENPKLSVLKYLIEDVSLGKIRGMAPLGCSAVTIGDPNLALKIGQRYIREVNYGSDTLEKLRLAFSKPDKDKLIENAKRISDNLKIVCDMLQKEMDDPIHPLPLTFYQKPEHGAYVSAKVRDNLIGRGIEVEPGKYMMIENIADLCKALLVGHKDGKDQRVAVAANSPTDLQNTLRIFVDTDPRLVRQGVRNLCAFLRRLEKAPYIDYTVNETAGLIFS